MLRPALLCLPCALVPWRFEGTRTFDAARIRGVGERFRVDADESNLRVLGKWANDYTRGSLLGGGSAVAREEPRGSPPPEASKTPA